MNAKKGVMRDVFLERLYGLMSTDEEIFILSADFGSPRLDAIKRDFADRFINVGIAEQNLINVATGLAIEGFKVYAYAIAPFLTMRAYEQIRVNLALQGQLRKMNVNLVGVGAGLGYDVSGPTHHCLEDLGIMRMLPNIAVLSPSDWELAGQLADYTATNDGVKYLRFEGKPVNRIYDGPVKMAERFTELKRGDDICLVSTGFMTHRAIEAASILEKDNIRPGLIDLFMLSPFDTDRFIDAVKGYRTIVTIEEGFIGRGGLDTLVSAALSRTAIRTMSMGFEGGYVFDIGDRDYLHRLKGLDASSIAAKVSQALQGA